MADSLANIHRRALLVTMACLAFTLAAAGLLGANLVRAPVAQAGWLSFERVFYSAFVGIGLGCLLRTLWGANRRVARAVRNDIKSIARMFHDVRHDGLRTSYPMALEEFAAVFQYLRNSSRRLVEEKERLEGLGLIDHLSQLSNRRHFETRLQELFDARKTHGASSVLIIDLDHLKAVNDRYGHDTGDALIVAVANALRGAVRQTDFLARLGGDEFCIVYPYTRLEQATRYVERLRKQLPRTLLLGANHEHSLKWTGGLSVMADGDGKFDDVLWRADKALMQAKAAGRNNTQLFPPEIAGKSTLRILP